MYPVIKEAVKNTLKQITGIDDVIGYEPQAIHTARLIYVILEGWDNTKMPGFYVRVYTLRARVCFRWQDNEGAELELDQYVDAIPDAIGGDPFLGGAITRGEAKCTGAKTNYVDIAGVIYRVLDVTIEVTWKG